jgi:hypothetical protein
MFGRVVILQSGGSAIEKIFGREKMEWKCGQYEV